LFLLVRWYGETLTAPAPPEGPMRTPGQRSSQEHVLLHVLLALAAVIVTGRLLGKGLAWLGQPPVLGEVVAGIVLGPSVLGWISRPAQEFLLPETVAPYLGVIAQLGVILYMFLVGLELNAGLLRSQAGAALTIAHTSIVVPFLLGAALALWLYPLLSHSGVSFTSFALFLGVALAITAFPVLARILTDRQMTRTELGVLALGCAALGDVTAWCLLAFVVGVARAQVGGALVVIVLALLFLGVMFAVIGPVVARLARRYQEDELTPAVATWVFVGLLLAALVTEAIGIHAIFGAFLLGALIPHDTAVARVFTRKLEEIVTILLLPAFFAYVGMRTQIGLVSGVREWLICAAIIAVATVGKFGGTLLAARLSGLSWNLSASLGVLMNTRGLMELIVLNIGLDLGVISPTLFAMMVLMALVTTLATTPILQWLQACQARGLADSLLARRP